MTVAIGLVCSDGVIVASDSMTSAGGVATYTDKVNILPDNMAGVWTAAGSKYVIDEARLAVESAIREYEQQGASGMAIGHNVYDASRQPEHPKSLVQVFLDTLTACYNTLIPNSVPARDVHPFFTHFLVGAVGIDGPHLLEVHGSGVMLSHDDDIFYAIGSGRDYATAALETMRHYFSDGPPALEMGVLIAYRTIDMVCNMSSQFVGGRVQMAFANESETRVVEADQLDQLSEAVSGWKIRERSTLIEEPDDELEISDLPSS